MAQVIVEPRLMRAFAQQLEALTNDIRSHEQALHRGIERLGATWQDQRYRSFDKAITLASVQLQIFYRKSAEYSAYLGVKASAADRYLGRR